jgi:phage terminase small subunit
MGSLVEQLTQAAGVYRDTLRGVPPSGDKGEGGANPWELSGQDRALVQTFVRVFPVQNDFWRQLMKKTPPEHLQPDTRRWWRSVVSDWQLDEHHIRLLTLAAEVWDRCEQARQTLAREGLTYTDRFGQPTARPEVGIERDSRIAFARLVRELDLDGEPASESRPPALRSNRALHAIKGKSYAA